MKKLFLTLSILGCFNAAANSNEISVWQDFGQNSKNISHVLISSKELKQRSLLLDETLLKSRLSSVDGKITAAKGVTSNLPTSEVNLPLPDGSMLKVQAIPSKVITDSMAEAHPEIKTWNVRGIDDPDITGVIDFTSKGFHGMLMMPDGDTIFIDPDKQQAGDVYNSFSKKENINSFNVELNCGVHEDHNHDLHFDKHEAESEFAIKTGARALDDSLFPDVSISQIKTYRLALSATTEYTDSQGGTAAARASMVTSINRINPIFTRDLGISLELIDAPELIFTNKANDPFSDEGIPGSYQSNNYANTLMRENSDYLSDQLKLDEFDIGHVLSHRASGGSGVAFLGTVCVGDVNTSNLGLLKGLKAAGATTSSNPTGSTFDLVLLAHELGHQLGANHSFNSQLGGNCSSGRSAEVAVEPGSGSTIMSYSGLCGSDDLIDNPRDDYFHFAGIAQINEYTRSGSGSSCGTNLSAGSAPSVNAGANLSIPANTPFLLDGNASGGTSSWDQIDIGSASAVNVDTGDNAIIRHNIPTSEQDRYIPSLENLFAGTSTKGEILPQTSRELNFAYVVRNGGISSDKKLINVTDTKSTFSVLSHSSDQTITTNQSIDVVWNTASSDQAPISCDNVDIQLIRENGVKNLLLASTPNDGTQNLLIPDATPTMSGARIFVGCSDNSFFNISSGNIVVQQGAVSTDTTDPVIIIQGTNPVSIEVGTSYTDGGATVTDNVDDTISVIFTGSVNTDVIGTYNIIYSAIDIAGNSASATRIVNVIAAEQETTPVDTTPPVITLSVDAEIVLQVGQEFVEPEFSANDDQDGTTLVTVEGLDQVDTSKAGEYVIIYTSVDESGNRTVVERTVVVTEDSGQNPGNELTSESSGGGGSFGYLMLPLMILLGLRRPKPIPIRVKKD